MDILLREAPFRFPGGIELPAMKDKSTSDRIRHAPIPQQLILPLKQHIGQAATPLIAAGDKVLKGQLLAIANDGISANIHAPTSGTVVSIGPYPVPHPSTNLDICIKLIPDGEDMWIDRHVTQRDYQCMTDKELIEIIRDYGIVGLGGAVFPADIKLQGSLNTTDKTQLKALIINGAECEPYISCDDMLMREYADEIIDGIKILIQVTGAARCMFAIEDNKPQALNFIREALRESKDLRIELYTLPSIYPQGGEKQLLQSLTGEQIPSGGLPLELGYLMFNVATVKAIRDAVVDDQPMLSRVVTVCGDAVRYPQNIYALIGTPVYELIEFCGGYQKKNEKPHQLIMGGPLMGVSLQTDAVPVVKAMNCLLVANEKNTQPDKHPQACIRCGECAQVCPASLLPQQLYWYSKAKNYPEAERFNLNDCIECGACDLVCPSHIPLVQYFRYAKGEIKERKIQKMHSDIARERFEFREQRLQKIAQDRAAKLKAKKDITSALSMGKKNAIDEIMQRVNKKNHDAESS